MHDGVAGPIAHAWGPMHGVVVSCGATAAGRLFVQQVRDDKMMRTNVE